MVTIPLALAWRTDTLPPIGVGSRPLVYAPTWDGFQAVVREGRIWSR
ncbi:hypothetical protein [Frankia sp. CiP3]|nr:hypothetical protein [Frankia sp. CiP3]